MTTQTGTGRYERLLERCAGMEPIPTAVAYPCDESSLAGALDAGRLGLIQPILVGPAAKIQEVARTSRLPLGNTRIVEAADSHAAAAKAVELRAAARKKPLVLSAVSGRGVKEALAALAREIGRSKSAEQAAADEGEQHQPWQP